MDEPILHRPGGTGGSWLHLEPHAYKEGDSSSFSDVTRQILFDDESLDCELRYFEVGPGGYSTLERHSHVHAVVILRGSGQALVGETILDLAPFDLVRVPSMTWHQFKASREEPLGFLCMVNAERDRPQLPTADDIVQLKENTIVSEFIRY